MRNTIMMNRFCDAKDRFYDYQNFCERMALMQSRYKKQPIKEYPYLKNREKKKTMAKELQDKINFDMNILLNKMRDWEKNHRQYHPKNQKFFPLPTSLRLSTTSQRQHHIDTENKLMFKRIQSAKGCYSNDKFKKDYEKVKYYREQLMKNSRYTNPCLTYVTPHTYEKKLYKYIQKKEDEKKEKELLGVTNINNFTTGINNNKRMKKGNTTKIVVDADADNKKETTNYNITTVNQTYGNSNNNNNNNEFTFTDDDDSSSVSVSYNNDDIDPKNKSFDISDESINDDNNSVKESQISNKEYE